MDPVFDGFIPRWYLIHLLHVSKLWYSAGVKYLYRSIASGSHAPSDYFYRMRYGFIPKKRHQENEQGHEVVDGLCRSLTANPQLATLVIILQLGIEPVCGDQKSEWAKTITCIPQLCPNVRHVEIRGVESSNLDALIDVLKERSLISFCVSLQNLSFKPYSGERGSLTQIC